MLQVLGRLLSKNPVGWWLFVCVFSWLFPFITSVIFFFSSLPSSCMSCYQLVLKNNNFHWSTPFGNRKAKIPKVHFDYCKGSWPDFQGFNHEHVFKVKKDHFIYSCFMLHLDNRTSVDKISCIKPRPSVWAVLYLLKRYPAFIQPWSPIIKSFDVSPLLECKHFHLRSGDQNWPR